MNIRAIIVRYKQYYTRGSSWFSYIAQFGIITANAKLFEEFFKTWFGWDVMQTILIGVVIFVIGVVVIGLLDFKYGVWRQENDWGWDATPKAAQLCASVANIEREICKRKDDKND